ncbi:MAG: RagB/SusD family nutrient uptake outer membrane protein, partial [Bacteroides sp.]
EIGPTTVAWAQDLLESNAPSYRDAYNVIHHVNLLFLKIEDLTFTNPAEKNRIKAEAYFLRAYTYFLLLRVWGDVPLVTDPVLSDDVVLKARSSKSDVMAFILSDIEQSLSLFPESGYINKNYASMPAAHALKADALMWKAKVLKGGATDFQEAIKSINAVESSGVSLLPDYAKIFDNANKKNNEIIFSFYFERYETGNLWMGTYTTSRTDNLSMAVNLDEAATSPNQSRHVYAPSNKARGLYLKNPGDKRYKVAMIDLVDKDGKLILTQTNKFRGKVYADDRYFDDDLIAYRWGDLLLLRAEA